MIYWFDDKHNFDSITKLTNLNYVNLMIDEAFIKLIEYFDPFDFIKFFNLNNQIKIRIILISKFFNWSWSWSNLIFKPKQLHLMWFCNKYNINFKIFFPYWYNYLSPFIFEYKKKTNKQCIIVQYKNKFNRLGVRSHVHRHGHNGYITFPSILKQYENQYIYEALGEEWSNHSNEYDRLNGPSIISKNQEKWMSNGKLHRIDGPALTTKYEKSWLINGIFHRTNGPARIIILQNKNIIEEWYCVGLLHRINGPARIIKSNDKKILMEQWFIYGSTIIQ